jgi:hypothetical protein
MEPIWLLPFTAVSFALGAIAMHFYHVRKCDNASLFGVRQNRDVLTRTYNNPGLIYLRNRNENARPLVQTPVRAVIEPNYPSVPTDIPSNMNSVTVLQQQSI